MTIAWGDTGRVAFGSLKTFNVTLATPYENLLATPQSLGTAAPTGGAAGDISYTLTSSDFPTISPSPYSVKYCAYLILSGQNLSGSSANVSYSVLKNGTSIVSNITQSGVANNNYWTHTHYRFYNVQVGDKLEAQTWASVTGVNLNYYSVVVFPSQLELTKADIVKNMSMTLSASSSMTKGNPTVATTATWMMYPTNSTSASMSIGAGTYTALSACIDSALNGYSLGRLNYGDASLLTYTMTSGTYYPDYVKTVYPSQISFREVLR